METQQGRTTKEITTPGGNKVVINDYLSGGEMRKVQAVMAEGMSASDFTKTGGPDFKASSLFKAQELALEFLLISFNGMSKTESLETLMSLPASELEFVMSEIDNKIGGGDSKKKV